MRGGWRLGAALAACLLIPSSGLASGQAASEAPVDGPAVLAPGPPASDGVAIVLDGPAYVERAPLTATVVNGLQQTIYAQDEKTDCSILVLEQSDGTTWQPISGCGLRRLAMVVPLAPGGSQSVAIDPLSFHLGVPPGRTRAAFGAGTYRLRLSYALDPATGPGSPEPETAYSDVFSIVPPS